MKVRLLEILLYLLKESLCKYNKYDHVRITKWLNFWSMSSVKRNKWKYFTTHKIHFVFIEIISFSIVRKMNSLSLSSIYRSPNYSCRYIYIFPVRTILFRMKKKSWSAPRGGGKNHIEGNEKRSRQVHQSTQVDCTGGKKRENEWDKKAIYGPYGDSPISLARSARILWVRWRHAE